MRVILQEDVQHLGKIGDVVNVSEGFARNLLFPRKMAIRATEKRIKEWEHLQKIAEIKKKKLLSEKETLLNKLDGTQLTFQVQTRPTGDLFGSITPQDISKELEKQGYHIDRKDINVEPIKIVGDFQALIQMDELKAHVNISVQSANKMNNDSNNEPSRETEPEAEPQKPSPN